MRYDIIVTWMDGAQETYHADSYAVRGSGGDSWLHVEEHYGVTGGVKDEWNLPLCNIRIWKPVRK